MSTLKIEYVNTQTLQFAACWYAMHGIRVFPVEPGGKRPLVAWTLSATDDLAQIMLWWNQWPDANIGLAMGEGYHTLDLDQDEQAGKNGWLSYLEAGGSPDLPWPVQETPGGGKHLLWRLGEEVAGSFSNFARRGPYGGLDMRTAGGYILGAPSVVGGRTYCWSDGDPSAPVPGDLLRACLDWSRGARERGMDAFPRVDPAAMTLEDVAGYRDFLESFAGKSGDLSRDAYHACRQAFDMHWSLQQMERVGPETWLGSFGSQEPHNAADPWDWLWRYTVRAAWIDSGRVREKLGDRPKESPPGGGQQDVTAGKSQAEDATERTEAEKEEPPDLYSLLRGRAESLEVQDEDGAQTIIRDAVVGGLSEVKVDLLLEKIKASTTYSLRLLRGMASEVRGVLREARQERRQEREERVLDPVWVQDQGKVLDPRSGSLVSKDSFLTVAARSHDGDMGEAQGAWLTGADARAQEVMSLVYHPGLQPGVVTDRRGVRVWNQYRHSGVVPLGDGRAESIGPWLNLLRALRLEEGERAEAWLLDRLAWIVQRPGEKINHGVLLGGDKGIGKDSFLAPLVAAVGRENTKVVHGEELSSDFCDYLRTKLLVVNEIDYGTHRERRRIAEKLKPVLAAPPTRLRVNEKNLRPYEIPNLVQVVGMTNHRICMHADDGERRWLMLWCGLKLPPAAEEQNRGVVVPGAGARGAWDDWFRDYWAWLDRGGVGKVLAFLRARDLAGFNPAARPPVTRWLDDIMMQSRDPVECWLLEQIERKTGIFERDIVTAPDVLLAMQTGAGNHWLQGVGNLNVGRIGRALHAIGARSTRDRYVRGWRIRGQEETRGLVVTMASVRARAERAVWSRDGDGARKP